MTNKSTKTNAKTTTKATAKASARVRKAASKATYKTAVKAAVRAAVKAAVTAEGGDFIVPPTRSQLGVSAPHSSGRSNYQVTPTSTPLTMAQADALRSFASRVALRLGAASVHENGGGTKYRGAHVSPTTFLGVSAVAGEQAWLGMRAVIQDRANVNGHVIGNSVVGGNAYVAAGCSVEGMAKIMDNVQLIKGAVVRERVCVGGHMTLSSGVNLGGTFRLVGDFTLCNASFDIGRNLLISKIQQIRLINAVFNHQVR